MWIQEYSKQYQGVTAEQVWKVWQDIENWPTWHDDLEYCKLKGDFSVGSHFILKPKKMRAVKIHITDIKKPTEFTDCTKFPGAKMFDTHRVETTADGVILHNKIVVTGPLRWVWVKLVAEYVASTTPEEMDALIERAAQSDK